MRRKAQDKAEILHELPPTLPINAPPSFRNRILSESQSFPFKSNQTDSENIISPKPKQTAGRSLINMSMNNQKKAIIRPDGKRINPRQLSKNVKQHSKRIQAPFATDTPPINSARRNINKKPQLGKINQTSNFNSEKYDMGNTQYENNDINSPRKFFNEKMNNQHSYNNIFFENNESIISPFPNKENTFIQQTDFQNSDLPLLPSTSHILKLSQFPKKTKQIEAIVKEHRKLLNNLKEIVESRIPQKANDSLLMIKKLVDNPLKNLFTNRIQTTLRDLFEKNSSFEKIIDSGEQKITTDYQQINDFLNEQKTIISQFTNSINTFESSHYLSDTFHDVSRLNDKISFTISEKLKSIENDEVLKLSTTLHLQENFDLIKSSLDDQFNSTRTKAIYTVDNECQKLAEQIQLESIDKNKSVCEQLTSEIQNLSTFIDSNFTDFEEVIEQTSLSMKLSLEEFEKSYQEAIDDIIDENTKDTIGLGERLNTAIENSYKSFEMFRNETSSTLDAIEKQTIKSNDDLLHKIEEENDKIKQNSIDVQKKFDNFVALIENERNYQLRHFFDLNRPSEFDIDEKNQSVFNMDTNKIIRNEVAPDMALLKYSIDCADSAESRIQQLESSLELSMSQIDAQIDSINQNLDEATQKVEKLRLILSDDDKYDSDVKSLCGIEKMIEIIEKRPKNAFNCAQKPELLALEQITKVAFEEKIAKVFDTIDKINQQIDTLNSDDYDYLDQLRSISDPENRATRNRANEMTSFKYFENSLVNDNNCSSGYYSSEESAF